MKLMITAGSSWMSVVADAAKAKGQPTPGMGAGIGSRGGYLFAHIHACMHARQV